VRAVLVFLPAGPDSELETATGNVVDARRHLRLERGVPVLDGRDQHAEPDLRRVTRERGEQRPRLEAVAVRRPARPAEEVVADPERIEARFLRALREVADLGVSETSRGRDDDSKLHAA